MPLFDPQPIITVNRAAFSRPACEALESAVQRPASGAAKYLSSCRRARGCRLLPAVTTEDPGRGELAELMPDHVLGDEHLEELVPVVDLERVAHELGNDR